MTRKRLIILGGLIALALLFRFGKDISLSSFGGAQEIGSGPVLISPKDLGRYLPAVLPSELAGLNFNPANPGLIPQAIVDRFLANQPGLGISKGSPVQVEPAAGGRENAGFVPTFTPQPTLRPSPTATTVRYVPTGDVVRLEPKTVPGAGDSAVISIRIGSKDYPDSAFRQVYGERCQGNEGFGCLKGVTLEAVVPMSGTFTIKPVGLVVKDGNIYGRRVQISADGGPGIAGIQRTFVATIGGEGSYDLNSGVDDAPEFWMVGSDGGSLYIQRIGAKKEVRELGDRLHLTLLEQFYFPSKGGILPTPTVAPTMTPTATATQPAAKNTPTRTPTRSR